MKIDLWQYEAVLLDLDGTLYHEDHGLPGAAELVDKLQRAGRKFACLSNSTSSPNRIRDRLERMGIRMDADHIYSAAAAAADYIIEHYPPPRRIYNLATEGMQDLLDEHAQWVQTPDEPCDAVVVGAPSNVYAGEERQRTALMLLRRGADLIGICPDRVYPSPRGLELGVGAHCAMLGYAANVEPFFCGKPQEVFFRKLCQKLRVDPRQCVLIGDNPESDVVGARQVGMRTILTLTGVATRQDIEKLDEMHRPDAVIQDLRELV